MGSSVYDQCRWDNEKQFIWPGQVSMSWEGIRRGRESEKNCTKTKMEKDEEHRWGEDDHEAGPQPLPHPSPAATVWSLYKEKMPVSTTQGNKRYLPRWSELLAALTVWWEEKVHTRRQNVFILRSASLAARRIRGCTGGNWQRISEGQIVPGQSPGLCAILSAHPLTNGFNFQSKIHFQT